MLLYRTTVSHSSYVLSRFEQYMLHGFSNVASGTMIKFVFFFQLLFNILLKRVVVEGGAFSASSTISNGIITGGYQWTGAVAVGTKVYAVPNAAERILIFDTESGNVTASSAMKRTDNWQGAVAIGTKWYAMPYDADTILIFDTVTEVVSASDVIPGDLLGLGKGNWVGAAAVGSTVYGIPTHISKRILIFDTVTGNLSGSDVISGSGSWRGAVNIGTTVYGVPSMGNRFLIFDTTTGALSKSDLPPGEIDSGGGQWSGAVKVGKTVYGIPFLASRILIFDTVTGHVSRSDIIPGNIDSGAHQWHGGVAVGTTVYGMPYNSDKILIFDTVTETVYGSEVIPGDIDTGSGMWFGAVAVGTKVYGVPNNARRVIIYDTCGADHLFADLQGRLDAAKKDLDDTKADLQVISDQVDEAKAELADGVAKCDATMATFEAQVSELKTNLSVCVHQELSSTSSKSSTSAVIAWSVTGSIFVVAVLAISVICSRTADNRPSPAPAAGPATASGGAGGCRRLCCSS
jgi:hypothetical protein